MSTRNVNLDSESNDIEEKTDVQKNAEMRIKLASMLVYFAYLLTGRNSRVSWLKAKEVVVLSVMDNVVEKTGLVHPSNKDKDGIQIHFDGGPIHGETNFVEDCDTVHVRDENAVYRRTKRMFNQQVVFSYDGPMNDNKPQKICA